MWTLHLSVVEKWTSALESLGSETQWGQVPFEFLYMNNFARLFWISRSPDPTTNSEFCLYRFYKFSNQKRQ